MFLTLLISILIAAAFLMFTWGAYRFRRRDRPGSWLPLRDMIAVSLFAALTAVGAWISVPLPFGPVPIALASLLALLSGAILGKWLGPLSQIVYVLLGVAGIPVFAHFTAGPGVVAGPTGGYLAGYIAGAFAAGILVEYLPIRLKSARFTLALAAGTLVIYLLGVPWLMHVTGMNLHAALVAGVYPFLPGDAIKIIIGSVLCLSLVTQLPQMWRSPAIAQPGRAENK
jgi:biotin transport system substrate-specific component